MIAERELSMPFWCVGNPVGDPFGPGILDPLDALEVARIIAGAGKDGLVRYTSAHDDDLVPWNPRQPEDDLDPKGETRRTLERIREVLEKGGIAYRGIGTNLHADPVFRNGGLANPDPRIRALALQKTMRALRIGSFMGADSYTYWVARDGFETQFAVPWDRAFGYVKQGLDLIRRYIGEKGLSFSRATIEHKPNEPRGEMFLPTVGHAIGMIYQLEDPDFWGVNPEVLQHDQMAGLTSISAVAYALAAGKLFFLHVGNQKPNQFDNDNPPMIGMDGIKEFISILYVLGKNDWRGFVEFDNHMLRSDAAPGDENGIALRRKYIELTVESYRMAERKAGQLVGDGKIADIQGSIWDIDPDLERVLAAGKSGDILARKIDYDAVNVESAGTGRLDHEVNRLLLGMR